MGRLPGDVELALYRLSQEAITNVVRHASASRVSVVLLHRYRDVTLLIEDNGRGFDPAEVTRNEHGGLGLSGMKERVGLMGGTCDVESAPGRGTTIRVRIQLDGEKNATTDTDR